MVSIELLALVDIDGGTSGLVKGLGRGPGWWSGGLGLVTLDQGCGAGGLLASYWRAGL